MPVLAEASNHLPWYVARSAGWIAWAVCVAALGFGLALSSRLIRRKGAPAWMLDLHRFLGTLALVFTAIHLSGLLLDDYVGFGPAELFIPLRSAYEPGAVAWGISAMYLLLAIQVSSWAMRHLPRKLWHRIHLCSFPLVVTATIHGFTAGTDRDQASIQWAAFAATIVVVFLVAFRLLSPRRANAGARAARAAPTTRSTPVAPQPVASQPVASQPPATEPTAPEPDPVPTISWTAPAR